MDREVVDLYLDDIIPNRFQPREVFNEEALRELAESIKQHGVIQPIIVRKIGDKYEIIAGERRYKASAMAGMTKVPAIIRNLDDKESSKVALLENLQRKDLTPIEEARTYQKILELDAMTQENLGRSMGKSQAAIANKMRLLSLPDEIQEALLRDQISERHARSLLSVDTREKQVMLLNRIRAERLTVRELDSEIKKLKEGYTTEVTEELPIIIPDEPKEAAPETLEATSTLESLRSLTNMSLEAPVEDEEPSSGGIKEEQTLEKKEFKLEDLINTKEFFTLRDAVGQIKELADVLEKKGFSIKLEEMDFERLYQVVMRIDKDK